MADKKYDIHLNLSEDISKLIREMTAEVGNEQFCGRVEFNLNNDKRQNLKYLRDYMPRTVVETKLILDDFYKTFPLAAQEIIGYGISEYSQVRILDMFCGTGGAGFEIVKWIAELRQLLMQSKTDITDDNFLASQLNIELTTVDGNASALKIYKNVLEKWFSDQSALISNSGIKLNNIDIEKIYNWSDVFLDDKNEFFDFDNDYDIVVCSKGICEIIDNFISDVIQNVDNNYQQAKYIKVFVDQVYEKITRPLLHLLSPRGLLIIIEPSNQLRVTIDGARIFYNRLMHHQAIRLAKIYPEFKIVHPMLCAQVWTWGNGDKEKCELGDISRKDSYGTCGPQLRLKVSCGSYETRSDPFSFVTFCRDTYLRHINTNNCEQIPANLIPIIRIDDGAWDCDAYSCDTSVDRHPHYGHFYKNIF